MHTPGNSILILIRPIVSNIKAPTYNFLKHLVSIFSFFEKFDNLSVKNNKELLSKLSKVKIANHDRPFSFDVVALFPSILIGLTFIF